MSPNCVKLGVPGQTALAREAGECHGRLRIVQAPPQHVGLGVTTSVILGSLFAVNHGQGLQLSRTELQQLSGRGGASGVGVWSFFDGGFVIDAGHPRTERGDYMPSGASRATHLPMRILHCTPDSSWMVRLLLPHGRRWSGEDEVAFFAENTPIPDAEVLQTLALLYHGLLPSVLAKDLPGVGDALFNLNLVGFKAREVDSHGVVAREVLVRLRERGFAAGMSSMGPLIYVIGPAETIDTPTTELGLDNLVHDLGVHAIRTNEPTVER